MQSRGSRRIWARTTTLRRRGARGGGGQAAALAVVSEGAPRSRAILARWPPLRSADGPRARYGRRGGVPGEPLLAVRGGVAADRRQPVAGYAAVRADGPRDARPARA